MERNYGGRDGLIRLLAILSIVVSAGAPVLGARMASSLKPQAAVIAQTDAPISITAYSASRGLSSQVQHTVGYSNRSGKAIVAVEIGLVSFDVWNKFLHRGAGVAIEDLAPGGSTEETFSFRVAGGFQFLTGVAYVNRVRFSDGTIWNADREELLTDLRKIEPEFDAGNLVDAKPEGGE